MIIIMVIFIGIKEQPVQNILFLLEAEAAFYSCHDINNGDHAKRTRSNHDCDDFLNSNLVVFSKFLLLQIDAGVASACLIHQGRLGQKILSGKEFSIISRQS